jgi:hypothetical protein
MISIYTPSNKESNRLLDNVETWIKHLRSLNVSADIAAYIARDFLSPMRIQSLNTEEASKDQQDTPSEQTNAAFGNAFYMPKVEE